MANTLSDIEALVLQCNSESSKLYISEAIACYKAGAYRSSIVSTWIAVVFDLIDKVRELVISGDSKAKALYDKYERYIEEIEKGNQTGITKALEFEREIVNVCKQELGFFDQQQFTDLKRLKEDRHRCAHPSFQEIGLPFTPSAELARLHIRNAIVHVLSAPPVQGKAALASIVKQIESEFLPEDEKKAFAVLEKSGLACPTDSLVKSLVDKLIFGFFQKDDSLYQKIQVIRVLNSLHEKYPELLESRLKKQLNKVFHSISDEEIIWAVFLAVEIRIGWPVLDQEAKDKVKIVIQRNDTETILYGLNSFIKFEELERDVNNKINILDVEELSKLLDSNNLKELVKERSMVLLSESRSYDRTNLIVSRLILPMTETMSVSDVERVLKMPSESDSDLIGANSIGTFINRVREKGIVKSDDLNSMLVDNGFDYLLRQKKLVRDSNFTNVSEAFD